MKEKVQNFVQDLHNSQYDTEFYKTLIESDRMIIDHKREIYSLNGQWNFSIDQYDTCLRAKWYLEETEMDGFRKPVDFDYDHWELMNVPSCWNTENERYMYYEGPAIYTRKFNFTKKEEKRTFLKFGAIAQEGKIFLNKTFLGTHKGGSTPFYIEVTDFLKKENRLLVVVDNTRKLSSVPSVNTDWFNYGGIYRSVELISTPLTFIKDYTCRLDENSTKRVCFDIMLSDKAQGEVYITIDELKIKEAIKMIDGKGTVTVENENILLWEPNNPKLYSIELRYKDDIIEDKVGFRTIETQGTDIFLNGAPILLKGICIHEESVKNGKAVTEAEVRENLSLAKELGCNYVRLAHYPHSEIVARIADEVGMLLWEEIPVYWWMDFTNPMTFEDAKNQLSELIHRDKNRASVIIWSVGNENADTDERFSFMRGLVETVKELDPTRLVSAACLIDHVENKINDRLQEVLDIIAVNEYYGWYEPDFNKFIKILDNSSPNKPVIISEFGGDGASGQFGTPDDLGTESCQDDIYRKQIEMFKKTPYIKGTSPWILFDFRCPRRHGKYHNGYNIKGLLNADKTHKKIAFYRMEEYYNSF